SAPSPTSSRTTASFGLATRLGLGSLGKSRPRPSLTLSSLATAADRGLIARMPFCPMPSSATTRSLLVTPSSFARSITFIRPATATLPPPPDFQDLGGALARSARLLLERARQARDHERPLH